MKNQLRSKQVEAGQTRSLLASPAFPESLVVPTTVQRDGCHPVGFLRQPGHNILRSRQQWFVHCRPCASWLCCHSFWLPARHWDVIIVFSIVEFPIPHCIPLSCVQMPLSPIKPSHQTSGPRCLRALQLVNLSPSFKVPKSASQVQTQAVIGVSIQHSLDQTNPWSSNVPRGKCLVVWTLFSGPIIMKYWMAFQRSI